MKKMKAKEFEKIMSDCGYDFEIYGYEGILNHISILAEKAAMAYHNESKNIMAQAAEDESFTIYTSLKERGYYEH